MSANLGRDAHCCLYALSGYPTTVFSASTRLDIVKCDSFRLATAIWPFHAGWSVVRTGLGVARGGQSAFRASISLNPAALAMVQIKLLDGHRLSSLAIRRLDRADMFAFAAHDDDAP